MSNHYVVLTGSKNNAGDFLIKYRAKQLFAQYRSDRIIVDKDAWLPFNSEDLKTVNAAKALILLGGPSLQKDMRPKIYSMSPNLGDIKVPIISMGIGWKSINGSWIDTYNYPLSKATKELLERVNDSGYLSSVRDYHTLNALRFHGFKNFRMTGCPAYYDTSYLNIEPELKEVKKVAFSLGVSFIESSSMQKQMKEIICELKEYFSGKEFQVVFHHSLNREEFLKTHNTLSKHNEMHNLFSNWLKERNIDFVDISGSAENLMEYYQKVDLHIGYRVHAHIFMNSISKASVLLSEDGRAKGVRGAIGGLVIDAYFNYKTSVLSKILGKIISSYDRFEVNTHLSSELVNEFEYELKIDLKRIKLSKSAINSNFEVLREFIGQLP